MFRSPLSALRPLASIIALAGAGCGFDWTVPDASGAGGAGGAGSGGIGGAGGVVEPGQTTSSTDQGPTTTGTNTGGGDPNDPKWGSDVCNDCLLGAADQGCGDLSAACQNDDGCLQLVECTTQCGGDQGCVEQCASNVSGESYQLWQSLVSCAVCEVCAELCSGSPYDCG